MTDPRPALRLRPIRVAPGVREANRAWQESKPESAYAVEARTAREHMYDDRDRRFYTCESQCDRCHTWERCIPSVTRVGDLLLCADCARAL